jgi:hypothetical protein
MYKLAFHANIDSLNMDNIDTNFNEFWNIFYVQILLENKQTR